MAVMIRAARTSFSQVLPMLIKLIPFIKKNVSIYITLVKKKLTISTALVDVSSHGLGNILGTNVALSTQQELDIFFGRVKD
jgi:hypothetical protein